MRLGFLFPMLTNMIFLEIQSPFISIVQESVTAMKQKYDITRVVSLNLSIDQDTFSSVQVLSHV